MISPVVIAKICYAATRILAEQNGDLSQVAWEYLSPDVQEKLVQEVVERVRSLAPSRDVTAPIESDLKDRICSAFVR